jgi:hypothetical protein
MAFKSLICRWPNGDISLVAARTRTEVDSLLDEVDNPDCAEFLEIDQPIAVHFTLRKIELGQSVFDALTLDDPGFNERLMESVRDRAYPILNDALSSKCVTQGTIDAAIDQEKAPIYDKMPDLSEDPGVAAVQTELQMPRSLADHLARLGHEDTEDEEVDKAVDLDELYEAIRCEKSSYAQMKGGVRLIAAASAQNRVLHVGQSFRNSTRGQLGIVTAFVTCPDTLAPDLRTLIDHTVEAFLREHGIS